MKWRKKEEIEIEKENDRQILMSAFTQVKPNNP